MNTLTLIMGYLSIGVSNTNYNIITKMFVTHQIYILPFTYPLSRPHSKPHKYIILQQLYTRTPQNDLFIDYGQLLNIILLL